MPTQTDNRLTWTDEPPTEGGWYWLRISGLDDDPRPVKVYEDAEYGMMYRSAGNSLPIATHPEILWAGPIPEPVES